MFSDDTETVCFLSADLRFVLTQLRKRLTDPQDIKDLDLARKKSKLIQRKAQKMENRLKKYREGIERLGFERRHSCKK